MNPIYTEHVIKADSTKAYLIVFGPFILGLLLFFIQPFFFGLKTEGGIFQIYAAIFYPFLFILSVVCWIEQSILNLLETNQDETKYKCKSGRIQLTVAKWALILLEVITIAQVFFQSAFSWVFESAFSESVFIGISIVLMGFMLFSFYVFMVAGNWLGVVLVEAEANNEMEVGDDYLGVSRLSRWFPKRFKRTHKRIRSVVNKKLTSTIGHTQ